MVIDEIMESFFELEKRHYKENKPLPTGILLSLDAYKEIPPNLVPNFNSGLCGDIKICDMPVSIADTKEYKFKWIFPEAPKQAQITRQ